MLLAGLLLLPLLIGHTATAADEDFPRSTVEIRTAHGQYHFNIRIADTAARQELGLMFQTQLAADEGMLFPQAEPRIMSMWMKNTYIPLDMLFIDSRGRIVCLLAMTTPAIARHPQLPQARQGRAGDRRRRGRRAWHQGG